MSIEGTISGGAPARDEPGHPFEEMGGRGTSIGVNGEVVARLQKGFDAIVVAACGMAAMFALAPPRDLTGAVLVVLFAMFAHLLVTRELGGYRARGLIDPGVAALRMLAGAAVAGGAGAMALASSAGTGALVAGAVWWLAATAILAGQRAAVSRLLRGYDDAGRLARRVAVVGGGEVAGEVIETMLRERDGEVDLCGFFDDRSDARTPVEITGCPHLGSVEDLIEFSRWMRIDLVVVALPLAADRRIYELLRQLWVIPADIRISAAGSPLRLAPRVYSYLGGVPLLEAFARPLSGWNGLVKDVFDRVVAAALLVLLAPVLAGVALAVRLDSPGPVLFRQPRYGFNNQLIDVLKFRSMYHGDSDRHARRLVTRQDPRVTRVGRFIRRASLDELPQLINVVKGELSLVGPRPHAVMASAADTLYDDVVEGYLARHRVKPGVTGWAQINGWRGETDTTEKLERRVEHDLYYIENWSLWLDVKILLRTPVALLSGQNAY
jgi:Undecaprenyl-phosphate glucose phosphotransferase